ncbi:MAG: rhamnogalacturonan acetylesterase, partial [Pyrinomonadaceae bacterium]
MASSAFAQKRMYEFGSDKPETYSRERGYGFEPDSQVICWAGTSKGNGNCNSTSPFYFSAGVPEGNYRVTVKFGDPKVETSNVVKAELRRLILERVDTKPGEFVTRSFVVNVRTPVISTGGEVKLKDREKLSEQWAWDEKLTLEFNGTNPSINRIEIEPVNVPTVFLLGDSTVCDQPGEPYASWGQMITRFFDGKVAVANHAES